MFQLLAPLSSDPQEACLHPIFFGSSSCRDATRISTKLGRERPFHANFLIICFIWSFGLSVLYHCYYSNGCFFFSHITNVVFWSALRWAAGRWEVLAYRRAWMNPPSPLQWVVGAQLVIVCLGCLTQASRQEQRLWLGLSILHAMCTLYWPAVHWRMAAKEAVFAVLNVGVMEMKMSNIHLSNGDKWKFFFFFFFSCIFLF